MDSFCCKKLLKIEKTIYWVFIFLFFLNGFPFLLDLLFGTPRYTIYPGFRDASQDLATHILFCLYLSICPVIWWIFSGPIKIKHFLHFNAKIRTKKLNKISGFILLSVLVLPALFVLLSPQRVIYFTYTIRGGGSVSESANFYHIWVAQLVQLSILAMGIILIQIKNYWIIFLGIMPIIFLNLWFHGKRSIVAFFIAIVVFSMWKRGFLNNRRFFITGALLGVGILIFSSYYLNKVRHIQDFSSLLFNEFVYEYLRVDFGRDADLKFAIYAELHPKDIRILDYRGQSLIILASLPYPRRYWLEKPESYATHVTTAAMYRPAISGGVTMSILGEAIANFSWFGFFIGPMAFVLICRIGDSCKKQIIRILTFFLIINMLTVHIPVWVIFIFLWTLLVVFEKFQSTAGTIKIRDIHKNYGNPYHPSYH